ncbi:DUF3017 domain-containing protein [Streptomyces uncialis]|uniref:DUF3017 domain-containing protein n=1 Tax=Streptomyces uncialis TaxID=1048205 RepID=UPI003866C26A|nr:DUF3017 domain-containing protein [Streptomyces uncialis]
MPADTPASAPGPGPGPEPDENPAAPASTASGADSDGAGDTDGADSTGDSDNPGDSGTTGADDTTGTAEATGDTEPSGESGTPGTTGVTEGPPVAKVRNRRFSLTRDTARPEGGGRAAPGDAPAPARQWPMITVLGMVGVGLLLTGLDVFRVGTVLIGLGLLTGGLLRWALPSVGMLAVRSRFTDMITYGVLGGAIVLLALMTQPDPVLVVPFLEDTLHFTIQ